MSQAHQPRPDDERVRDAVARARQLVADALRREHEAPRGVRARRARLARLVSDPDAAEFSLTLTDQVMRIGDDARAADRLARIVADGDLTGLGIGDRTMLRLGAWAAPRAPAAVMALARDRMRREAGEVILPAGDPAFARHVARRRADGVRVNVNVLGEAILGADEATRRLGAVRARLARPDVDYASVKISAVFPSVSALAFDDTVTAVAGALGPLYADATSHAPAKFVNLDMEEYRDLALTTAVFRRVLDEPRFVGLEAGIVLQAYLPDSHDEARALAEWARERRQRGGAAIKVRVVKGANLAMELVDAEMHGWTPAPYPCKEDVDASYKALLDLLLDPRYDGALRVGLASHNLFDVAWGLVLRDELAARGQASRLEFEMLEGMAPAQADAVRDRAGGLVMYAPVATRDDFPAAIAYLVRRLDENTAPQNFLAHLFTITPGNDVFAHEAERFEASVRGRDGVRTAPRRTQDRTAQVPATGADAPFANAPDTDFTRPANRAWITAALAAPPPPRDVPLLSATDVDAAVAAGRAAHERWWSLPASERTRLLTAVGDAAEARRGEIIAAMAHETGKTVPEGDPEVSEGVDMARYYAREHARLAARSGAAGAVMTPRRLVVVAPPWNFPFAIPMGGVMAALAAGGAAILKPAPEAIATGRLVAACCDDAGLPPGLVTWLPCPDGDVGRRLVTHPDVDAVILTGALETARRFLQWRPGMRLHGETSGKNAMVITATADLDLAVRDLVRSAFGHQGQKCSAASLAIVEATLYDDPRFRERLRDATCTLRVGPATHLATDMGPLVAPPGDALMRALTRLDPGEEWLVEPHPVDGDPALWSPGVRLGVRAGAWFHRTECFGPVLGVMRATSLDHAIALQNAVAFGLTAGLHSLDPGEIARWSRRVEAGNLYVNRTTTGAIVRRQPFGGWKRSAVGPTAKAGGPNYVARLADWHDDGHVPLPAAAAAFDAWMAEVGTCAHDPSGLVAETNAFRYRPLPGGVAVRTGAGVAARSVELCRLAAASTGCRLVEAGADEGDAAFAQRLEALGVDRVRLLGPGHDATRAAAHALDLPVDTAVPVADPVIELPRWLHEQVLTVTRHRHGHISHEVG